MGGVLGPVDAARAVRIDTLRLHLRAIRSTADDALYDRVVLFSLGSLFGVVECLEAAWRLACEGLTDDEIIAALPYRV